MKQFLLFVLFLFLCNQLTEAQQTPTFADLPGPEHVLVVYNGQSDTSLMVMNYYKDARQIPNSNIVDLSLPSDTTIIYQGVTHSIQLTQQGEIIKDIDNENNLTPTIHAWIYFNEKIAKPIADWLTTHEVNGTPLKDIIRFIVLCKGVPFRIDARKEDADSRGTNVVCANLLTHLGETMEDPEALLFYYNKTPGISNPYYNADPTFSMMHRFIPNHYQTNLGSKTIKLSYLVTHLSAPRFEDIQGMIDRSLDAINATNYDWFIDAKTGNTPLTNDANATITVFSGLGIENYFFDLTNNRILNHEKPILSYASDGIWAGFDPDYIQSQLSFEYSPGAFFSSWESHNGLSIGTFPVIRTRNQGLLADFTLMGGTIGVGQAFHSPGSHVIMNNIFFPSYAVGYTFIEAAYLGLLRLDATNVVVGDPLTMIYNPVFTTLPDGYTFNPGNYSAHYYVPAGNTVYFNSGGEINFWRNSSLKVDGELIIEQNANVNFDGYSKLTLKDVIFYPNSNLNFSSTLVLDGNIYLSDNFELKMHNLSRLYLTENCQIHFGVNSRVKLLNNSKLTATDLLIQNNQEYYFADQSGLDASNLFLENGAKFYFNSSGSCKIVESFLVQGARGIILGKLNVNDFIIYPNSEINFLQGNAVIGNSFTAIGEANNRVSINMNPQYGFSFEGTGLFDIQYCDWQGGTFGLSPSKSGNLNASIANSNFSNYGNIFKFVKHQASKFNLNISNTNFSNYQRHGIELSLLDSVLLYNCSFSKVSTNPDIGILNDHCNNLKVENCDFVNINRGVVINIRAEENQSLPQIERKVKVSSSQFSNVNIGIEATMEELKTLEIKDNVFIDSRTGILITNFIEPTNQLTITNNFINYKDYGISLTNGNEVIVLENQILSSQNVTIENQLTGVYISHIANPYILSNVITETNSLGIGPGIFSLSSNGQIRRNTISGHLHGIELSGSAPDVASNIITGNKEYGIYAGSTSIPHLGNTSFIQESYPLTGYNNIYENGACNLTPLSEIYLSDSYIELSKGCNTISDDRYDPNLHCDNRFLMDGDHVGDIIYAEHNYWGDHPLYGHDPEGRFGEAIQVYYQGYLEEPCNETPGELYLLIATSEGTVVDTVFGSGSMQFQQSDLEQAYSAADKHFFTNNYSSAVTAYRGITDTYGNIKQSLKAYSRLYQIHKLINATKQDFTDLRNYYNTKLSAISDTVMILILKHLADICLIAEKEYLAAIGNFENIANNNPDTDLAFYSELNALTTSLLASSDSTMGKISGKYAVNGIDDYYERINKLSQQRSNSSKQEDIQLPKEFNLYQNYPNPFNPNTKIKFDIPEQTEVELIIYDILGRKIKTIVNNELKQPGYYEINFNASELASGIYFYRLRADKFISTKKMLIIK